MRLRWFITALVLSALLACMEVYALTNYLFWRYVWFDVPMHFLGGATVGVFLVGLLLHFRPRLYLLGVVLVSLGWEVFEYLSGFPRESNFVFDTTLDLLMDALGATLVYVVARFTLWRSP